MNKPTIKTVKLVIPAGSKDGSAKVNIPRGTAVYMAAVAVPAPATIIDISASENNQNIIDPIDIRFYDGGIGAFQQRARLMPYNGGSDIEVFAKAVDNVVAKTTIEVVFEIWQEHDRLNSAWDQQDSTKRASQC